MPHIHDLYNKEHELLNSTFGLLLTLHCRNFSMTFSNTFLFIFFRGYAQFQRSYPHGSKFVTGTPERNIKCIT
jgi:hypothetical protein